MYLIEVLLFILIILVMVTLINKREVRKHILIYLLTITVVIAIIHLLLYGFRWQLFSFYLAFLSISLFIINKQVMKGRIKLLLGKLFVVLSSLFIIVSIIATFSFPTYELPVPSGQYIIGTESFVIVDDNRLEQYSDNDSEYRKIKIQVWYPANTSEGYNQVPWLEDGLVVARALSKDMSLPYFVLDQTVKIDSNAYLKAPISNELEKYPVVVISHGWRGFRNLHTDFAEELASRGYIVIAIDHTFGSVATVFNENDISLLNLEALPQRETTDDFLDYANQLVNTYAGDISLTIDYLESINTNTSSSRFSGRLDLTEIGLLGHSTGGGAGVALALNDERIDAVFGLDAWVEPINDTEINKSLKMPSLFIRSEAWEVGLNNANLLNISNNSIPNSDVYQIDGTTHYDFAMVYMYSPLTKAIDISGEINSEHLTDILKSMMNDFFDKELKNDSSIVFNTDDWIEVKNIID